MNILFPHVHPRDILTEPILAAEHIDPGYSDHANDVWRVQTASRVVALRIFNSAEWGGPFWSGLRYLFHWRWTIRKKVTARNRFLQQVGGLRTPRVLSEGEHQGLEWMAMEWLPGERMESFAELSEQGLYFFGRHLAAMHARTFPKNGTVDGSKGWPARMFPSELRSTLNMLFDNYHKDQPDFARMHADMYRRAADVQVESFSPVMVDLCASQYLRTEQGELCALVDTDAYVIGPRELDFVILEYGLTPELAKPFARGYSELLPLPNLRPVRPLYRYLYRMMEVEGDDLTLKEWMGRRELF